MSFQATVLKVMIASPGDLTQECEIVTDVIHRWNYANSDSRGIVLLPITWKHSSTPQMGDNPQSIINRQLLQDTDIVIAIFGTRIGTPTEDFVSGTVEEIKRHVTAGKIAKVYFSDVPMPPSKLNSEQYASVLKFRDECKDSGLYATFDSLDQLKSDFAHHITLELNQPRYTWLSISNTGAEAPGPELSDEASDVLVAAVDDGGKIMFSESLGGPRLGTHKKTFALDNPRITAKYRAAVETLVEVGAFEIAGKYIYRVSDFGYGLADKIANTVDQAPLTPFDESQLVHTSVALDSLQYSHRDCLRLLLLKGGAVQGSLITQSILFPAQNSNFSLTLRPLIEQGFATREDNNMTGIWTLTVTPSIVETLKQLLFPRREGHPPFFKGLE